MAHAEHSKQKFHAVLGAIAGLILLLVWMAGGFDRKTQPGTTEVSQAAAPQFGPTVRAEWKEIDDIRAWPATVSARSVAQIAAKVPGRVLEVLVKAGDAVEAGQMLVRLEAQELQARLNQARAALAAAEAQAGRAGADARRMQNLFDREAATRQMLDAALAASRATGAQVTEARAAVAAAESAAGETVLRAPFGGAVVRRLMDPGDMALPGQPVLTLQSEQALRVEAAVPESCARLLKEGQELAVRIGPATQPALIEEIAPAADPQTRTVLIKAALESRADTHPGVFAWLEQACGSHRVIAIPAGAVSRVGQLESVRVVVDGQPRLRHVRTGKTYPDSVEILSGLKAGDVVLAGGGQ